MNEGFLLYCILLVLFLNRMIGMKGMKEVMEMVEVNE